MKFAECIIQRQPLATMCTMSDISKLCIDMAIELLNASELLDYFCHYCGMQDTDNGWIKCDNCE